MEWGHRLRNLNARADTVAPRGPGALLYGAQCYASHRPGLHILTQISQEQQKNLVAITYFIFASELEVSMGEVAPVAFDTVFVLGEVLAEGCLVQIVELLTAGLLLSLHHWHRHELRHPTPTCSRLTELFSWLVLCLQTR